MRETDWLDDNLDAAGHLHKRMSLIAAALRTSQANGWHNPIDDGPGPIPPEWSDAHEAAWGRLSADERGLLEKWRGFHVAPDEQPDADVIEAYEREFGRY